MVAAKVVVLYANAFLLIFKDCMILLPKRTSFLTLLTATCLRVTATNVVSGKKKHVIRANAQKHTRSTPTTSSFVYSGGILLGLISIWDKWSFPRHKSSIYQN